MAELKRVFVGAKMDKDSDHRFIQPGDYIDARNIEIISSEGNDAGVVRNKVGTTKKSYRAYNPVTQNFTEWLEGTGDTAPFGFSKSKAKSIGIHKDTPTNTIYNFIYVEDGPNIIMQYLEDTDVIAPIIVDTAGVLEFNATVKITGISIIEGTLAWVQEETEPKAIKIDDFKAGSTDFITHTQYNGRDFVLSDVTMMKLAPISAPAMSLSTSNRDGITSGVVSMNFTNSLTGQQNDGDLVNSVAPGTPTSLLLVSGSGFLVGDKIKLTAEANVNDISTNEYEVNLVVTAVAIGGSVVNCTITSITDIIEDNMLDWDVEFVQATPMFELVFPRFGYRWRYKNNQVSPFSPFTQAAFLPDTYEFNAIEGYNTGMVNGVRKVTLTNFGDIPLDVGEIEILYKESNSTAVYVVESIEATLTEYVITDSLIDKLVEANQILRPWDAVPKSGKALEVIGNRFIIGNYKQGYDVEDNLVFTKAIINSVDAQDVNEPERSIKSLRTYQAGVIFKDSLGRETSIFTDKTGVVKSAIEESASVNKLEFQMQGDAPEFATHFKYFVKDTANEYYNLVADRLYHSEDRLSTWVSFPSSERNKLDEESYLIAKKYHDKDLPVIEDDNKYKVIDILNEAPEDITTEKVSILDSRIYFDQNFGDGVAQTTKNIGSTPTINSKVFLIASDQTSASSGCTEDFIEKLVPGTYIRFSSGNSIFSNYYEVASVLESGGQMKIMITDPFGEDINFLYTDPAEVDSALVNDRVSMTISEKRDVTNQAQFIGRFFVKLAFNSLLEFIFATTENYLTLNASTAHVNGYINSDVNFKILAGGASPRLGYTVEAEVGGLNVDRNPSWANDDINDIPYDIVFEKRHGHVIDADFITAINTVGTKIRFSNHDTIYTIEESRSQYVEYRDDNYTRYWTLLDRRLTTNVSPNVTGEDVVVELVGLEEDDVFTSKTPAVFETEPAEGVGLDIYYEASDAFPISEYNDPKILDYYNCFSFGNGVESNRLRDDYNAVTIDKGPKVSTVLDKPYKEEHLKNDFIFSGIYNSNSGVNNLNQFIIAESITKSINPIYGSVQKIHARDTDMLVFCEDKTLQVLANKDALYNADGSTNITASNNVLGDVRPFVGEFGISTDPASFASYGFRVYFTDRKRGVPIRLSRDGLTPIMKGLEDELEAAFKTKSDIIGSFDDETSKYNLTINGITYQYSEEAGGWTDIWELSPDQGITLNNQYYTAKFGVLWAHNDEVSRNTWYDGDVVDSSITLVFNDEPSTMKKFKTLSYEGDKGWIAPEIETELQSGKVLTWEERESIFYNYIQGVSLIWDNNTQLGNLDPKEFSVQGIGNLDGDVGGVTDPTDFIITVCDAPSGDELTWDTLLTTWDNNVITWDNNN